MPLPGGAPAPGEPFFRSIHPSDAMAPDRFDLDSLLQGLAESAPPSHAQQALVKTLMEIDYLPTPAEKVAQIEARIEELRVLEAQLHARIVNHPDLKGKPPPPAPPPSVAREFLVLMAVKTALEKLGETRAALARRLP